MEIYLQILWLFILALPIACVAWTVTHEEVFREIKEYCTAQGLKRKTIAGRKFFYLFTCEYCFSHYVTVLFIFLTDFHLLLGDWRGYIIAGFSLVWVANLYMNFYAFIRQLIKKEKTEITVMEKEIQ